MKTMYTEQPQEKMTRVEIKRWRIFGALFGFSIPAVVIILGFLFQKDSIVWLYTKRTDFELTSGRVVASYVEYRSGRVSGGWHFVILYEYDVAGKAYVSDRVHYSSTGSSDESYANDFVAKYPVGAEIVVYYDPQDPEESVLEPDTKDYEYLYMFLGSLIFGFLIALSSLNIR